MIGSLTIEKANLNISYMLASLKILSEAEEGSLSRQSFIYKMSEFMGTRAENSDGGENRVPYNKTKFDRYFGFIDINQAGDLLLTPRGKRIIPYIVAKPGVADPDKMYEINPSCRNIFQELFLDSCCFDSFGSYNCGAETSNSDIEPPRVILKALESTRCMTKWELGYVLWGLDQGAFDSFSDALQSVEDNRQDPSCDYRALIDRWGKVNFVSDFKMVDLLSDENVGLIAGVPNGGYRIASDLSNEAKNRIAYMNPIATPIQMFLDSRYSQGETLEWIRTAMLGRISDSSLIFECDASAGVANCKQVFADAINRAYAIRRVDAFGASNVTHMNSTVTLIVKGLVGGAADIDTIVPGLPQSFIRKNDFKAQDHGWTANPGQDHDLYELLVSSDRFAARFGQDNVFLPANRNIIGVK